MYKIPSFHDIPVEFNVALLRGAPNTRAIHSSKAVGEVLNIRYFIIVFDDDLCSPLCFLAHRCTLH